MTTSTETGHRAGFIVSEANGSRSREPITILSGENVKAGTVLGRVDVAAATPAAVAGNTGNGTIGTVTVGAAKEGVYRLTCIEPATNLGDFAVEDPDGINVGVATVGTEFVGGGLTFTIADGSTDFAAGDAFTITVAAGSGKFVALDLTDTNGGQNAVAVVIDDVDASAADAAGAGIVRDAEVNGGEIIWPDGITNNQKTDAIAQLKAVGIIVRSAV